jgi:HlyD family type I secretion membrane fusion protein
MTVVRLKPRIDAARRPRVESESETQQAINDFQSDTVEIESKPDPWLSRATLYITAGMLIVMAAWGSIAELDKIVSARGKIVSIAPNIMLQPYQNSIVKSLNARPGDVVKTGQILATFDPTFTDSDVTQVKTQLETLNPAIERLEAEQAGRPYDPAPELRKEPAVLQQLQLWRTRQAQYTAQKQSFDDRIARTEASIRNAQRDAEYQGARLKDLTEIEEIRRQLAASQSGSKLNLLAASVSRKDAELALASLRHSEEENRHMLADLRSQRETFVQQWQQQLSQELSDKRTQRDLANEQLAKAVRMQDLVTMTAPMDAIVLDRADRAVGSIVRGAEPLFTLVPLNAPLEVSVTIPASEIGFVREGDPVQIKLDAYDFQRHGSAEGVVQTISRDSFSSSTELSQQANKSESASGLFYRAHIEITKAELRNVPPDFRLVPGLPLVADIKVGERSVMSYFLKPILQGINESMREP